MDSNTNLTFFVSTFDRLSCRQLYEILKARAEVFVVEQNIVYLDMDDTDYEAIHACAMKDGKVVAYARAFPEQRTGCNAWHIGRVLTTVRRQGLGHKIVHLAMEEAARRGAERIRLDSQSYAVGFYEKLGFVVCSEEMMIEGIPHLVMEKNLPCNQTPTV